MLEIKKVLGLILYLSKKFYWKYKTIGKHAYSHHEVSNPNHNPIKII